MSKENQCFLCACVNKNILMNEHLLDQQKHVLNLVIQHAELFYLAGDSFFSNILYFLNRHFTYLTTDLSIDVIAVVTSYFVRRQQTAQSSQKPQGDLEKRKTINSLLLRFAAYLLSVINAPIYINRCCELIKWILLLTPREPIDLSSIFSFVLKSLRSPDHIPQGKSNRLIAVIAIFQISVKSLTYFHAEYIQKNQAILKESILYMIDLVNHSWVFSSLILLLPELFAAPYPYSTDVQSLFTAIKDALFGIYKNDEMLIRRQGQKQPTRIWRVLHLIKCIVERTPSTLSLFIGDLMICCGNLMKIRQDPVGDSHFQRSMRFEQNDTSVA